MASILNVAKYIFINYKKKYNENIDEMKLHKLLYFSQRESFAIHNKPLFKEQLEGWILGPVSPIVRDYFVLLNQSGDGLETEEKNIINNVIDQYGCFISTKLSEMTHSEISWLNSRKGLKDNERGNKALLLEDIKEDAKKVRPFDSSWGMYYDEFDDKEVEL